VVAIDPAVTNSEESDETGIVVAGLGTDGHGYVLDDFSGRYSPDGWARKAILAYHQWGADRVVAEVNNGGDLVATVLRTVDPNVSYSAVHASRGKVTRAEPVAALYEQRRVHHVGTFAELEDQLCQWTPGDTKSPDRLDALVWAVTELMVQPAEITGTMVYTEREQISPF
jgi:predicted phage terminase large subunit-like protein